MRPGLQSEVGADPLDHRRLDNGRNDLELAAAVRAVLAVELKSEASAKTNLYSSFVAAKTRLSTKRCMNSGGDMRDVRGAVMPGGLQLEHPLPGGVAWHTFVSQGRARDVAAQLLQRLAVVGAAAHRSAAQRAG